MSSAYSTPEFWTQYADYVKECLPRHRKALYAVDPLWCNEHVLDLGCGKVMEGRTLVDAFDHCHDTYIGVDLDPPPGDRTFKADYRHNLSGVKGFCKEKKFEPDMVLSMFSVEPTVPWNLNEILYDDIFRFFPTVQQIISAGFYYKGKELQDYVQEPGGLISNQTIPTIPFLRNHHERRMMEPGPSTLFGPDVIEVWRVLERR